MAPEQNVMTPEDNVSLTLRGPVSTAVLLSVRRKAELGGNIWRNQAECQDDRQILF